MGLPRYPHHPSGVPCPIPRRIGRVRLSISSPSVRPSPFCRRVGIRISTFEIPWRLDSDRRSDRVRLLNPPTLETTMQVVADRAAAPTAIQTDLHPIFVSLELSRSTWL